MAESAPEIFEPDEGRLRRLLFAAACCWAPAFVYLATQGVQIHSGFTAVMFACFGGTPLRQWWWSRKAAIAADDEGLWNARRPREAALVRWEDIDGVARLSWSSGLELTGKSRKRLLTIPIELRDFGRLEAMLVEKTRGRPGGPVHSIPKAYSGAVPLMAWPLIGGIGIAMSVLPLESLSGLLMGYWIVECVLFVLFMGFLVNQLQTNAIPWAWRLTFEDGRLRLWYPLHVLDIAREEVASISVGDLYETIWPGTGVIIHLKWGKTPVAIRGMRYRPEDIRARLEAWLAEPSSQETHDSRVAATPTPRTTP